MEVTEIFCFWFCIFWSKSAYDVTLNFLGEYFTVYLAFCFRSMFLPNSQYNIIDEERAETAADSLAEDAGNS